MPDSAVMVLPLPILTALLGGAIAALMLRLDWGSRAGVVCFAMLFGLLSFSSLLVGLRFGYGIDEVALVQRVTPLFVGPLLYLGFLAFIVPKERFNRYVAGHLAFGCVIAGVTLVSPRPLYALDWIISGSYLFYLCALVWRWRKGPDHLIHAHLGLAQRVLNWMLRGAVLLAVILVIDTVIAFDFALNEGRNATALISYVSIPMILILLGVLFALPQMIAVPVAARGEIVFDGGAEHAALEAEVRALLESTQLYLEPDLSVQRLARRMHVPVRALSVAINQTQGMNVSQYVNRFRMEHAADLLRGTDLSVAAVLEQSGFLTRSNFYREFQRVYGQSPAAFRQSGGANK